MSVGRKYLYYQRIKRLVTSNHLSKIEQLDLCYYYSLDKYNGEYSKKLINDKLFAPDRERYKEHCLENARKYFKRLFGLEPIKTIESAVKDNLKEGELVYDKEYNLYSWEKGKFHRVNYFDQ